MADVSRFKKKRNALGSPPSLDEASANLREPEVAPAAFAVPSLPDADRTPPPARERPEAPVRRLDGRSMRRTNRTVAFATRVSPDFDARIRDIALRDGLMLVEVLERALDAYEASRRESSGSVFNRDGDR